DKPSCGSLNLPDPNGVYTLSWEHFLTYFSEVLVNSNRAFDLAARPYPLVTIRTALERSYVFRPLAKAVKARLAKDFNRVRFRAQDIVFPPGSPADAYYILQSGTVRVQAPVAGSDRRKLHAVLRAGDQFGEMAILNDTVRSAEVQAVTDLVLYKMSARKF